MIYVLFLFFTLSIVLFVWYQAQYFLIFKPTYYREDNDLDERFEYLEIVSEDGVKLEGVMYEPSSIKATILFFGGRSQDSVGAIIKLAQIYPDCRVITFNYRSYGKSQGVVDEKNLYNDGIHIATIIKKNYGNFLVIGFSLGAVVCGYVTQKINVKALILIGAFDSLKKLTKQKYGLSLPFLRYSFSLEDFVKNISSPTYLFIGKDDVMTYLENGRNLKKEIKNLVFYKEIADVTHKELLYSKDVIEEVKKII